MTPEEQQAVDEATAAVLRYDQIVFDLMSQPNRSLGELEQVATKPQIEIDLASIGAARASLATGEARIDAVGPLKMVWSARQGVETRPDGMALILLACVDYSAIRVVEGNRPIERGLEAMRYKLVRVDRGSGASWMVSELLPPVDAADGDKPCSLN